MRFLRSFDCVVDICCHPFQRSIEWSRLICFSQMLYLRTNLSWAMKTTEDTWHFWLGCQNQHIVYDLLLKLHCSVLTTYRFRRAARNRKIWINGGRTNGYCVESWSRSQATAQHFFALTWKLPGVRSRMDVRARRFTSMCLTFLTVTLVCLSVFSSASSSKWIFFSVFSCCSNLRGV